MAAWTEFIHELTRPTWWYSWRLSHLGPGITSRLLTFHIVEIIITKNWCIYFFSYSLSEINKAWLHQPFIGPPRQAVTLLQHALSLLIFSNTPVLPRFIMLQPTNYRVSNLHSSANSHVIYHPTHSVNIIAENLYIPCNVQHRNWFPCVIISGVAMCRLK